LFFYGFSSVIFAIRQPSLRLGGFDESLLV